MWAWQLGLHKLLHASHFLILDWGERSRGGGNVEIQRHFTSIVQVTWLCCSVRVWLIID